MSRRAVAGGFGLFALIGAVQALYGPVVPSFQRAFGVSTANAGLALSMHFVGAVIGVVVSGVIQSRLSSRAVLAAGTVSLSVGTLAIAAAPAWWVVLTGAFVTGLGFGCTDLGFNVLFARGFGDRSAAMLNLISASFGIGAIVGPLAVGLVAQNFRIPFVVSGVLALMLLPLVWAVRDPGTESMRECAPAGRARPWGTASAFLGLYVLYVGIETGVGGWEPTHLASLGLDASQAASLTSLYWAAVVVGRFVAVPLTLRFSAGLVTVTALGAAAVCLSLAHIAAFAPVAYGLTGLALAPVFPTGLAWLNRAVPSMRGAIALVLAGAMLGGVVFPAAIGLLIDGAGPAVVPTSLTGIALACALLAFGLWSRTKDS